MELIQSGLERQAREAGDRICLIEADPPLSRARERGPGGEGMGSIHGLTFAEVDRAANRVAAWLRRRGLPAGGRVALLLGNSPRYVAAFFGILKAGGVAVPLSPATPAEELARTVAHCGASLVLTGERPEPPPAEAPRDPIDPDAPAVLLFTSGSTGEPKGVALTHRNVVANVLGVHATWGWARGPGARRPSLPLRLRPVGAPDPPLGGGRRGPGQGPLLPPGDPPADRPASASPASPGSRPPSSPCCSGGTSRRWTSRPCAL